MMLPTTSLSVLQLSTQTRMDWIPQWIDLADPSRHDLDIICAKSKRCRKIKNHKSEIQTVIWNLDGRGEAAM